MVAGGLMRIFCVCHYGLKGEGVVNTMQCICIQYKCILFNKK